jgi:CheY-like chemotaxis protein
MKHSFKYFCFLLMLCQTAVAQQENPILADAAQRSPAVAAVLDAPHEKPADALAAVLTLFDLREYTVAAEVFKPLAEANLSAADQADLVRQFGTAKFLLMAREASEHGIADGREFAEAALAASASEAAKPGRLTQLIADLASDDAIIRQAARHDLAATGVPAAQACLEALAAATDKNERSQLLGALAEMSPVADPLVIAAIAEGQGQFRRDVAELAGHLHLLEAVPWLATIAASTQADAETVPTAQAALLKMGLSLPDQNDALAVVKRALEKVDAGIPTDSLPNETGLWWSFNPASNKFTSRELISCERRSLIHARLAENLLALPSASTADRQIVIISAVEAAHVLGEQPSQELTALAASLTTAELNTALAAALKTNRTNAAIACAELLATRADAAALRSLDGSSTPLAQAVAHPNRELKFAALAAIMNIHPAQSFPGASLVPQALWLLAQGAGTEQAVVGAPSVAHASDWAGNLRALGYDAIPAVTGIELVQQALASPRLALVLVDSDIGKPLVREVLYQLRAQPQLAHTPIAVLVSNEDLLLGERLATVDDHLLAVPRPHTPEAMQSIVTRIKDLADTQLSADERTDHAIRAIDWLGQLFAEGSPYDELLRDAAVLEQTVFHPALTKVSLQALAYVGTAGSQRTLVDFVSLESQPIELRRLAVDSFAKSRDSFGVLLTTAEIALQYDRYNVSETASADTQQVLGQVLNILENRK